MLDLIWEFLTWPFRVWNGTSCPSRYERGYSYCYEVAPDRPLAIVAGIMVLVVVVAVVSIVLLIGIPTFQWAHKRWVFARHSLPCQHADCGNQRTLYNSNGGPGCITDEPCCLDCTHRHDVAELHRTANNEPKRICLHNESHGVMDKVVLRDTLVVDQCSTCHSLWLDADEIERIKEWSHDEGYSAGRSSASSQASTNMMLGVAIGTAIG